jgi:hypothetical protein
MNKNAACICTVSYENNNLFDRWNGYISKENYDKYVLTDITKNSFVKDGFLYTENDIRTNLNFSHEVSKKHYWNSHGNRNIIWFYAHLRMLNFFLSYPNYQYYWFFDDDVRIDDWNHFLTDTDKDTSDFISYFIFKKKGVKSQTNIPFIDDRTVSKHMWFERFPGHSDTLPEGIEEYFGSFFPTTRFSNRAMKKLIECNNQGYFGYGEGYVPTVLNYYGMTLNTLIKTDNTSDLFDNNQNKVYHKNTIINWEWI